MSNNVKFNDEKMLTIRISEFSVPQKYAEEYIHLVNEFVNTIRGKAIHDYFSNRAIYKHDYTYTDANERIEVFGKAEELYDINKLIYSHIDYSNNYIEGEGVDTYEICKDAKELAINAAKSKKRP